MKIIAEFNNVLDQNARIIDDGKELILEVRIDDSITGMEHWDVVKYFHKGPAGLEMALDLMMHLIKENINHGAFDDLFECEEV